MKSISNLIVFLLKVPPKTLMERIEGSYNSNMQPLLRHGGAGLCDVGLNVVNLICSRFKHSFCRVNCDITH